MVDQAESLEFVALDETDHVLLLDAETDDALEVNPSQVALSQDAAAAALITRIQGAAEVLAVSRLGGDDTQSLADTLNFLFASYGRWR